jgi:hypothetical protein
MNLPRRRRVETVHDDETFNGLTAAYGDVPLRLQKKDNFPITGISLAEQTIGFIVSAYRTSARQGEVDSEHAESAGNAHGRGRPLRSDPGRQCADENAADQ